MEVDMEYGEKGSFGNGQAGQLKPRLLRPPVGITKREPDDYLQFYREQRRRDARRRLPSNLRCPICNLVKLKPKQWLKTGICKSCGYIRERNRIVDVNVFEKELTVRYRVDGQKLRRLRQDLGLTLKVMAHKIGWTHSWLCKLEVGDVTDITEASYKRFQQFVSEIMRA